MTINQRQAQAYADKSEGYVDGTSPTLCVKLSSASSGMQLTEEDTNISALCMYTLSGGVVEWGKGLGTDAGTDADSNGFTTKTNTTDLKH